VKLNHPTPLSDSPLRHNIQSKFFCLLKTWLSINKRKEEDGADVLNNKFVTSQILNWELAEHKLRDGLPTWGLDGKLVNEGKGKVS